VFFGTDAFSVEVLKAILDARDIWKTIQVVTTGMQYVGRGGNMPWLPPLPKFATLHRIHHTEYRNRYERLLASPSGLVTVLPEGEPEPPQSDEPVSDESMLVVASFGRILPLEFLNRFAPNRRLNVHPSLLPHLRGPSPIQEAIYHGDTETGVSIIGVEEKIDTGDIWAQETCGLYKDDTFRSLRLKLATMGGRLLVDVMRKMLTNQAESRPQGDGATYSSKIHDGMAKIEWDTTDAAKLSRMWRAIGHAHPPKSTYRAKNGADTTFRMMEIEERLEIVPELAAKLTRPGTGLWLERTKLIHVRCANETEATFNIGHTEGKQKSGVQQWRNGLPNRVMEFGLQEPSAEEYQPSQYNVIHPHRSGPNPDYRSPYPT